MIYFDHYTLEGVIVYVLGLLFSSVKDSPAVRVSTLVDHLYKFAVKQALMMKENREGTSMNINKNKTTNNVPNKKEDKGEDKPNK